MRISAIASLAIALLLFASAPARACDPVWDWCGPYDPYWDVPGGEVPAWTWWEPEPQSQHPAWSDPVVWSAPGADILDASFAVAPAPAAVVDAPDAYASAAALGLHMVNEVFTGHTVERDGPVTTFASTTAAFDAGTAARLIASVGTGETTVFDGVVLGGRMSLSDGRLVAGDIYENRVWDGSDWVVNAYVFFQDDSEIARLSQDPWALAPATVRPFVDAPVPAAVVPVAQATAPGAYIAPVSEPDAPNAAMPSADPVPGGDAPPSTPTPRQRIVHAGLALAPQGDVLGRIEVLRGRRVALWVRAFVDDAPARVLAWRLRDGEVTMLGPVSGGGEDPLVGAWRTMPPQGSTFVLAVRATVEVPGEGAREVEATIGIVVRSPAIVE